MAHEELCHCGQPLHYSDPKIQEMIETMVRGLGPRVRVTFGGRTWLVPRHYIALHGLKSIELPFLGFEEVELKIGDRVRVHPHGQPEESAEGTIIMISGNQRSIAVAFGEEKPPFVKPLESGMSIHRELGFVLLAMRYEVGPWIELYNGGHYEIEGATGQ